MAKDKVVLITGASSGIGFFTARQLKEEGYKVYGTSRTPQQEGYTYPMLKLDVNDPETVKFCVNEVINIEGKIDVLINNAGFGMRGAVEESDIEASRTLFDVNLFGTLRMIQEVLPYMRKRGKGMIINISSIVGLVALPNNGIYSASKFALEGLSQALRMEVEQFGVKVALVNPGFVVSKFASSAVQSPQLPEYMDMRQAGVERVENNLATGAEPDIVTEAILEIIEEDSSEPNYIVGEDSSKLLDDWNKLPPEKFTRKLQEKFKLVK